MKQKKQCGVAKPLIPHGLSALCWKKAVCAVLSNAGSDSTCNEKNKNDIELVKIRSYGDSEGWIESKGGPINIVNSYDRY